MLPTSEYKSGTSPFVTVFERLGFSWMSALIQAVLIVAAMSSLNSGLYSTGRVLRSLGMSDEAPKFTLKMSKSGVPYAGILMTSIVFVLGSVLNALTPDAFEIAVEATSVMILFTWGTIFACQIRLRQLSDRGVVPESPFKAPGSPYTSWIGLIFLLLVLIGLAISGWQSSEEFLHKTSFLVVVFGVPVLALALVIGWRVVKPTVVKNTGNRTKAVWTLNGPTYGADVTPDDLDKDKQDHSQLPG
jgi:L-asparagine permease